MYTVVAQFFLLTYTVKTQLGSRGNLTFELGLRLGLSVILLTVIVLYKLTK